MAWLRRDFCPAVCSDRLMDVYVDYFITHSFSGQTPNEHDSTDHLGVETNEQQKVSICKLWQADFEKVSTNIWSQNLYFNWSQYFMPKRTVYAKNIMLCQRESFMPKTVFYAKLNHLYHIFCAGKPSNEESLSPRG